VVLNPRISLLYMLGQRLSPLPKLRSERIQSEIRRPNMNSVVRSAVGSALRSAARRASRAQPLLSERDRAKKLVEQEARDQLRRGVQLCNRPRMTWASW
jgi:hypothetical protein